eukprot:TRINITY_DN16979_c0_g3_i7.p3 TRINITY_DN16979_c0_g3~~TRINITY_DN16979_c0_g3_i7.p3  ORF type:complete len:207 (+),score=-13.09 TRINITY_DN16979_c0_g3_i7:783-1403(+)
MNLNHFWLNKNLSLVPVPNYNLCQKKVQSRNGDFNTTVYVQAKKSNQLIFIFSFQVITSKTAYLYKIHNTLSVQTFINILFCPENLNGLPLIKQIFQQYEIHHKKTKTKFYFFFQKINRFQSQLDDITKDLMLIQISKQKKNKLWEIYKNQIKTQKQKKNKLCKIHKELITSVKKYYKFHNKKIHTNNQIKQYSNKQLSILLVTTT